MRVVDAATRRREVDAQGTHRRSLYHRVSAGRQAAGLVQPRRDDPRFGTRRRAKSSTSSRGIKARSTPSRTVPDGKRLISAGNDRTARVWDAETGAELSRVGDQKAEVFAAAYSPDGGASAMGGQDHLVKVWDATETPASDKTVKAGGR